MKCRKYSLSCMLCYPVLGVMLLGKVAFASDLVASNVVDLEIIKTIESSGRPYAYNGADPDGGSFGEFQISYSCLADYNQRTHHSYTLKDLYSSKINTEVASWYLHKRIPEMLRYYHKLGKIKGNPVTLENVITAYNSGIKAVLNNKSTSRTYIRKYLKLKELQRG